MLHRLGCCILSFQIIVITLHFRELFDAEKQKYAVAGELSAFFGIHCQITTDIHKNENQVQWTEIP